MFFGLKPDSIDPLEAYNANEEKDFNIDILKPSDSHLEIELLDLRNPSYMMSPDRYIYNYPNDFQETLLSFKIDSQPDSVIPSSLSCEFNLGVSSSSNSKSDQNLDAHNKTQDEDQKEANVPALTKCSERSETNKIPLGSNISSKRFTPAQKTILLAWFKDHLYHPYLDHDQLIMLVKKTGLSPKQIRTFMVNTRIRDSQFQEFKIPIKKY